MSIHNKMNMNVLGISIDREYYVSDYFSRIGEGMKINNSRPL